MEIVYAKRVIVGAGESILQYGGVLVESGKILMVGHTETLKQEAKDSLGVIDLGDRTGLPGLIAHVHCLPGDGYEEELVGRIVKQKIGVCLTLNSRFGTREPARTAAAKRRVERMHQAGVRIIAGTDAGVDLVRYWEYAGGLIALANCGLSQQEVLRAATTSAAQALGILDRKGSLVPGKEADLIAVEGNPLEGPRGAASPALGHDGGTRRWSFRSARPGLGNTPIARAVSPWLKAKFGWSDRLAANSRNEVR